MKLLNSKIEKMKYENANKREKKMKSKEAIQHEKPQKEVKEPIEVLIRLKPFTSASKDLISKEKG